MYHMGHCMGLIFPLTTHFSITLCSFVPFTFATSTCGSAKVCTACASRQQQLAPPSGGWRELVLLEKLSEKRGGEIQLKSSLILETKSLTVWWCGQNLQCHKQMQGIVVSGMSIGLDPIRTICMPENIAICSLLTFMSYSQIRLLESNRSLLGPVTKLPSILQFFFCGWLRTATLRLNQHLSFLGTKVLGQDSERLHYHPHKKIYFWAIWKKTYLHQFLMGITYI